MSDWQTIDSAPKDAVILAVRKGVVIMAWWNDDRCANKPRPYWTGTDRQSFGAGYCRSNPIVAWQPLPAPPPTPGGEGA